MNAPYKHISHEDQVAELESELTRLRASVRPWSDKLAGETIKEQVRTMDAVRAENAKLRKEREEAVKLVTRIMGFYGEDEFDEEPYESIKRLEELYKYGPN